MVDLVLCVLLGLVVTGPQPPTRDAPPPRTGTAVISGIVTAADTGAPLRRSVVTLMPAAPPGSLRTVVADLAGRYEFTNLAAGTYRVRAMPGNFRGQYVAAPYGGPRAGAGGSSITLAEKQRFDEAHIALPRGGAINGRVLDEFGEPVARANVFAARVMGGGSSFGRTGMGAQTDDHGRFRLYGLDAADYIVAAEVRGGMMMTGPGPPPEGETEGFAMTYYPSTLVDREAGRVRIVAGGETDELHIQLVRTRTFRITGMVIDSQGRPVARPNVMLVRPAVGGGSSGSGVSIDQTGRFTMRDVIPGEYQIVVRPESMGGPAPPEPTANRPRQEYASMPLRVYADIDELIVTTAPGVSITGRIVFAEGPPLTPPTGVRIMAQPGDRMLMMGPPPTATVDADLQFTLNDIFGPVLVRPSGLPRGHVLESVRVGSTDITDEPFEFKASHEGQLTVVLTSRISTLEGMVTGDDGAAASGAMVLIIPEERTGWRMGSSRLRVVGGLNEGRFVSSNLLPGRYYVIAIPQERFAPGPYTGPEYFEALTKQATPVMLNADETRSVDLTMVSNIGGR